MSVQNAQTTTPPRQFTQQSSPITPAQFPPSQLPPNPYASLAEDERFRLNVDISITDSLFLKSISPRQGTIQLITALYVKSIVDAVRAAGINSYSLENIAKFHGIVLRHAYPDASRENSKSNVSTGETGIHKPNPISANSSANVKSKVSKGR